MAYFFGWLAWFSIPAGLVTAISTNDSKFFAISLILALWFMAAALMTIHPND